MMASDALNFTMYEYLSVLFPAVGEEQRIERGLTGKFVCLNTTPWDTVTRLPGSWDSKLRISVLARTSSNLPDKTRPDQTRPDDPMKTNMGSDIELHAFCISQSQLSVELTGSDPWSAENRPLIPIGWDVMNTVWQYTSQNVTRRV
jgi:hypothetical protein